MSCSVNSVGNLVDSKTPKDTEGDDGDEEPPRNRVLQLIQYHYGNTECHKSPSQIDREAYLLRGLNLIKFNRWFCMPAAVTVQFCVGSVYAWSVFNKPIDTLIDGHISNRTPITFTIAIGLLGLSAALMGPWLERNGPKVAALLGATLFFIGNLLTALALWLKLMWLVYFGYGVVGGFGIGLCYISPVSCLQKWFPDHRGLASGVAVCGFGAGSIAMAKIQVGLVHWVGLPWTFVVLGCVYVCVMGVAAMVLRTPPPGFSPKQKNNSDLGQNSTKPGAEDKSANFETIDLSDPGDPKVIQITNKEEPTLLDALRSIDFRLMYVAFLSNIIFGLVLISRLSNMVTDIFSRSPDEAATVVAINGGFNLAGRLIFSVSSDYIGRKNCYFIMLSCQLIILLLFSTITTARAYWTFLGTMWLLTSCYGAGFSVIPAFLSDKFGAKNIGACHGVILTAWSIAGVAGGVIFTIVFDHLTKEVETSDPYPYNVNGWWLCGVVCVGWSALIFVRPTEKDQRVLGRICAKGGNLL